MTAIQLAKALGATVIVTAGSDDKCAACVALGADHAINYRTQDFVAEVKRLTGGRGVDVVLDMVAGDYVAREVECLADDGRLAVIAVQGGTKSAIDAGLCCASASRSPARRCGRVPWPTRRRSRAALREQVWPLIEAGRVKPVIHEVFPAAEAAQAHALMESSTHVGKIVLDLETETMSCDANWWSATGRCTAATPANAELLAGCSRRGPSAADVAVCVPFPFLSRDGGHAGRQRHPLGRAGLLGARAGRLHRRGLGRRCWPSSAAAT